MEKCFETSSKETLGFLELFSDLFLHWRNEISPQHEHLKSEKTSSDLRLKLMGNFMAHFHHSQIPLKEILPLNSLKKTCFYLKQLPVHETSSTYTTIFFRLHRKNLGQLPEETGRFQVSREFRAGKVSRERSGRLSREYAMESLEVWMGTVVVAVVVPIQLPWLGMVTACKRNLQQNEPSFRFRNYI